MKLLLAIVGLTFLSGCNFWPDESKTLPVHSIDYTKTSTLVKYPVVAIKEKGNEIVL